MISKNENKIYYIFLSMLIPSLPLFIYMESNVKYFIYIPFIYNFLVIKYNFPKPKRKMLLFITFIVSLGLMISFRDLFSRSAGIPLLVIMSSLKLYEIKSKRDELVACFLSYFILLSLILYSSNIFTTIYMFLSSMFTLSVMFYINSSTTLIKTDIKKSFNISLIAIICAFILFFFFPRLQGTLWGKKNSSKNVSGFATSINPGSVSTLAKSNKLAFTVKYENPDIVEGKYFRGIVFSKFNGRTWLPKKVSRYISPPSNSFINKNRAFISLNATNTNYLIAPDFPIKSPQRGIFLTSGTILYSFVNISDKKRYEVEFASGQILSPTPDKGDIYVPKGYNNKTVNLGKSWQHLPKDQIVNKALTFFRDSDLEYSLKPGRLGINYIDQFLFETKKGFCEHFASSFAFLLRSANVPARLVGGYLGGEVNKLGDFINVRQSDAHVWCEVWLDKKGWIRIDPTTESVPERLTQNSDQILPESDFGYLVSSNRFKNLVLPIKSFFDTINFFWDQKIMGYDFSSQKSLLEFLGINDQNLFKKIIITLFAVSIFIFIIRIFLVLIKRLELRKNPELILFHKFQVKMEKRRLEKLSHEGYFEYIERLKYKNLEKKEKIIEFINIFTAVKYGNKDIKDNIIKMKKILKQI